MVREVPSGLTLDADKKRFVEVLENRGRDPRFTAWRDSYLDALRLPSKAEVLDLGSGSGIVARTIAGRAGFEGSVVGIELDPDLVQVANDLAAEEGLSGRVRFEQGDIQELDAPEASVDAVTAQTAISHVENPDAALEKLARVVRPGGRVAICDGDYEARAFGCSDHYLARAMEVAFRSLGGHPPRLMRDLPEVLHTLGFNLLQTIPFVDVQFGEGGRWLSVAERNGPSLAEAGRVTVEQVDAWLSELRAASERGTFFAAGTYYAHIGEKRPG